MNQLAQIRKAITAAVGAAAAAYFAGGASLSQANLIVIVGSFIVVGVATYFIPNAATVAQAKV